MLGLAAIEVPRMKKTKAIRCARLLLCLSVLLAGLGCGGSSDCDPLLNVQDPSGQWKGVLQRKESDCGAASRGATFSFDHQVSLDCNSNGDARVTLFNEDNLEFSETSFSTLGGGSFSVQNREIAVTIDISYDNFDGSLADVTETIRVYANGKIVCSEKYAGSARR